MPDVITTKAPKWFSTANALGAGLKAIADGTNEDAQVAPELCQMPAEVAKLLYEEGLALSLWTA